MKKIALAFVAIIALLGASGTALAQMHGGGGGAWHGGGTSHGGGTWHGGGGMWHGGSHHGSNFRVAIGFPFFWGPGYWPGYYPYYDPYSYYYPAAPIYAQPDPSMYIQQDQPAYSQNPSQQYSYYCPDPVGYYPTIQNCTQAWLRVVPDGSPNPTPLR